MIIEIMFRQTIQFKFVLRRDETRNQVYNIKSEIELRSLQLKTNTSPGTMDQETASTSSSAQNIILDASEESLQSYSRIPVNDPSQNNEFEFPTYLMSYMGYD